jgi:hypothetical protein
LGNNVSVELKCLNNFMKIRKFKGVISWDDETKGLITDGIFKVDSLELKLDYKTDETGGFIQLHSDDGFIYKGKCIEDAAALTFRFYSRNSKVALIGKWTQPDEFYNRCIIELDEIQ